MMPRKERERWLRGRKVHGVLNYRIACRQDLSLAWGWAFYEGCSREHYDLRKVTCLACRKALKRLLQPVHFEHIVKQ